MSVAVVPADVIIHYPCKAIAAYQTHYTRSHDFAFPFVARIDLIIRDLGGRQHAFETVQLARLSETDLHVGYTHQSITSCRPEARQSDERHHGRIYYIGPWQT